MGGFFSPPKAPAQDNSALEDTRKERDQLKAKNEAKMRAIKGAQTGRYNLLAFQGPDKDSQLSDTLGG